MTATYWLQELRGVQQRPQQEVYDATCVYFGRLKAQSANVTLRMLITLTHYYGSPLAEVFHGL